MQVKKQHLESCMEQWTGSELRKEYIKTPFFRFISGLISPCLFKLYTEHIMYIVELDELQAGIKIAGRNINNLRYSDDTTLLTERKE